MADLCLAFKRIVPRYQFDRNISLFVVEDLNNSMNNSMNNNSIIMPNGPWGRSCELKKNRYCSQMDQCRMFPRGYFR